MKIKPNKPNLQIQSTSLRFLCLLSVFLMLATVGCKQETTGSTNIDPTGVYALKSVNGKTLPCELFHEGVSPIIKSGTFTIKADGHCLSLINLTLPAKGDMSKEVKATYTRDGNQLRMQWEGAGMTMGTINGNTFTMTNEDLVFAYRK